MGAGESMLLLQLGGIYIGNMGYRLLKKSKGFKENLLGFFL
jgi:hypothetical protein